MGPEKSFLNKVIHTWLKVSKNLFIKFFILNDLCFYLRLQGGDVSVVSNQFMVLTFQFRELI